MARLRKPVDISKVESLAAQGMTEEKIALALGISPALLSSRKRQVSEISEALKRGRAKGEAAVTSKLWEAVEAGQPWAICFYLKCRAGWTETQKIDHSSSDGSMSPGLDIRVAFVRPSQTQDEEHDPA